MSLQPYPPVGTIVPFAGPSPQQFEKDGWLYCDGRSVGEDEYPELFAAIGHAWGRPGDGKFDLPDLRGQFLRAKTDDLDRDRGLASRTPSADGGSETGVGSAQTYGTAPPRQTFEATISNLKRDCAASIEGCMKRSGTCPTGDSETGITSGGDLETRPKNKYVHFLIKAVALAGGQPVDVPVGSLCAFAGVDPVGLDLNWKKCDGTDLPPDGAFGKLFAVIGYAHGRQIEAGNPTFVLPDYRGWFLRGVSGATGRDPNADTRSGPYTPRAPGGEPGNSGNAVGSEQGQATAQPVSATMRTYYNTQPSRGSRKLNPGTGRTLLIPSLGSVEASLTSRGGDEETRPANVKVDWYVRYV